MRVLFVSGIDGFCHRYEVLHRSEQNAACGGQSRVRSFVDPRLPDDLRWADAIFLYRVPFSREIGTLLERARGAGLPLIGSIDDLVFIEDADAQPPLDHLGDRERALWHEGLRRYRATLERCDHFAGPTTPLCDEARRLGWPTSLHPDAASRTELQLGRSVMEARERSTSCRPDDVLLGYFSGTPTHDRDFAVAAPALRKILLRHRHVRLLIVGPLGIPGALQEVSDRLLTRATVPWSHLPALVGSVDVNLAPLQWKQRFSAAKGELKYIEAGAVGVPTIASPTPAFREAISADAPTGRLAAREDDWAHALEELIESQELRVELGRAARRDVERRYSTASRTARWSRLLAETRSDSDRPPPSAGPSFRVPWAARALEPDACPGICWSPSSRVSPPLSDGSPLCQPIPAETDGLCAIDVHTVTYGQRFDHRLHLALCAKDGFVIAERTIAGAHLPDRGWVRLHVPEPMRAGPDRLEISARNTADGNAPSFSLTAPRGSDGERPTARLGERPWMAPLAVRSFVRWTDQRISSLSSLC